MKQILNTLIMFFSLAIVANNTTTKLLNGVYNSDHGDIHIINSKSGAKAVGLYQKRGHILLSGFTVNGKGRVYTGDFNNGNTTGQVAFTINNSKKWSGNWRYDTTKFPNWNGSWNGDLITTNKNRRLPLWDNFYTDAGKLQLVHNIEGKVGGFLYANGKEYYVTGNFETSGQKKLRAFISTDADNLKTKGTPDIILDWKEGFYGTIKVPGQNIKTVRGAKNKQQLVFKLQTIKNYENKGALHGEERGKIKITSAVFDEKGRTFFRTWYKDSKNKTYKEDKSYTINNINTVHPYYTLTNNGYYANPTMNLNFTYKRMRKISNAQDRLVAQSIPLKPIIEYLKFNRNASSFSNATDGRKSIPNSDHTFWLSESGGKRTARGYAFIKYSDNDKWGYFYTVELY